MDTQVSPSKWYVYILSCNDGTLYTGITKDLERRITEHNTGKKGAKYTRSRRPVRLVYFEETVSRSKATKREKKIKQLPLPHKLQIIIERE